MSVSERTKIMVWGRAGGRCSFEDCRKKLVMDVSETDDPSLVGDVAHIVADSPNGPRGVSPLTEEERDRYANLMLLCKDHHKIIDERDKVHLFPVELLHTIKQIHEDWVESSLTSFDPTRQKDLEKYAGYIDEWEGLVHLKEWREWMSFVLTQSREPVIKKEIYDDLKKAAEWLLSRVWPHRYPDLEAAFHNFRLVLNDFTLVFGRHINPNPPWDSHVFVDRFYRTQGDWNDNYHEDLKRYNLHVKLIQDLALELTRAANYVADKYRLRVDSGYRLAEGLIIVDIDGFMDMEGPDLFKGYTVRCEYRGSERVEIPYPGLSEFGSGRLDRDMSLGE